MTQRGSKLYQEFSADDSYVKKGFVCTTFLSSIYILVIK